LHALVMATCHAALPQGADAEVLVDIDLAILGAAAERFDEYEQQIRREYAWVEPALYRQVRSRVLADFLSRPRLYSTARLRQRFEQAARANLRRSIERLESGS
jgi:predicted metal-dependent HD superfamily phosphohydrolase